MIHTNRQTSFLRSGVRRYYCIISRKHRRITSLFVVRPLTTRQWPWEQAQLYEVYRRHAAQIMLLTFPDLPHLPWTSKANPKSQYPTDAVEPYCFSHWPGANCFITHYCSSKNQKLKLKTLHDLPHQEIYFDVMYLEDLAL